MSLTPEEIREVLADSRAELRTVDRKRRTLEVVIDACERLLNVGPLPYHASPVVHVQPVTRMFGYDVSKGFLKDRILKVMTETALPMKATEITTALDHGSTNSVRTMLNQLRHAGKVAVMGRGKSSMWRLRVDERGPAAVPKAQPKATIPAEDRDRAILGRLSRGPASSDDLLGVLPDVDDGTAPFVHLAHALRRLELSRKIVKLGPDRYRTA